MTTNETTSTTNKTNMTPDEFYAFLAEMCEVLNNDDVSTTHPEITIGALQIVMKSQPTWDWEEWQPYEPEDSYHLCDFCPDEAR